MMMAKQRNNVKQEKKNYYIRQGIFEFQSQEFLYFIMNWIFKIKKRKTLEQVFSKCFHLLNMLKNQ